MKLIIWYIMEKKFTYGVLPRREMATWREPFQNHVIIGWKDGERERKNEEEEEDFSSSTMHQEWKGHFRMDCPTIKLVCHANYKTPSRCEWCKRRERTNTCENIFLPPFKMKKSSPVRQCVRTSLDSVCGELKKKYQENKPPALVHSQLLAY